MFRMRIAFLGLGQMGAAIAGNLVKAGHDVALWNRTAAKARALSASGASYAATAREAASGRPVVLSMLSDDAALNAVLDGEDGLLAGLGAGALHISMSTIGVSTAEEVAARHAQRGQHFACAPVFGRPEAAAAAKLYIVAAGESEDLELAAPVFEAIGQRVFCVGSRPSAANLVKLCGNFMILASIEILGEALTLAAKGGIPKATLLDVLTGTLFDAPVFRNYGAILLHERYRPAGFAAPLGLKDMRLVGQSAETLRVPMPVLNVVRDHLLQTIALEGEQIDWSAIARIAGKNAGI
jgi:3-hydroxyisobutyrate dehydrogenase-like beta-hydroxyacid dehydrogenase